MYIKQFDAWNQVKQKIDDGPDEINIREGEIRWIVSGVNVGGEMDGKGIFFTRPGLIVHVLGRYLALVIPMSTQVKTLPGYVPFLWQGRMVALCLNQMRVISLKRILSRQGRISESRLAAVKVEIANFFSATRIREYFEKSKSALIRTLFE